jgi:hypothetical protein
MKEDPVDRLSVSREGTFPGQEMVNFGKNDKIPNEGETLGHGKQKVTPRMIYPLKIKGKTHGSKATTGVGFPKIKKYSGGPGDRRYSQLVCRRGLRDQVGRHHSNIR